MKIKTAFIFIIIALLFTCASCSPKKDKVTDSDTAIKVKSMPTGQDALDAVMRQDTKTLLKILEKDPKLASTTDKAGYTLLHIAAWKNNARLAKILLSYKMDLDVKGPHGFTAMHELLRGDESNDRKEILEMLIFRRADVNALTDAGNSPLDIAEIQDKQDFARVLKHYGAKRIKQTLDLPPVPPFATNSNEIKDDN